jgi:MFS family permease
VIASLLLFGRLSDHVGRRPVLFAALAASALSTVCFLSAQSLPLLLIGRVVSGLSAGVYTGTATATLVDLAPPGRRTRATLIATVANMGGLGLGPLVAGVLAQWAGSPLRFVFWGYLALLVPAAIGTWAMPETIQVRTHAELRPHLPRVPRALRALFVNAAIAVFAGFAVLGLFTAMAPAFLGQSLGVTSPAAVGLVVFLVFAASTAGQVVVGRLEEHAALPGGYIGLIAGMGLLALSLESSSLPLLILAGLVSGVGHGFCFRGGLSGLNENAPASARAEVASSYFVVAYLGISVPVIGGGLLTQLTGLRTAGLAFAAIVAAIATVGLGLLADARRRTRPGTGSRSTYAVEAKGNPA